MTADTFVLDGVQPAALPVGASFRVAYAPVAVPMTESQRGWCVVRFTVVLAPGFRGHEPQRMYRDDGWQRVTADEVEGLWAEAEGVGV